MEKIVLNPETFENVNKMLISPDTENAVTALMAMEAMDFRGSMMYMVLLYRDHPNKSLWEQNCPGVLKNIKALGIDEQFSFRSIYSTLKDKVSKKEMQVFLSRFGSMLSQLLTNWGFTGMIEHLNINVSLKD